MMCGKSCPTQVVFQIQIALTTIIEIQSTYLKVSKMQITYDLF